MHLKCLFVSYAVAGHATLDAWAAALSGGIDDRAPDSILIGCFGDPGLFALRECSNVRVTGLAEASIIEAARHGRFAIVTGGAKWEPMLRRLTHALGYADLLAGIRTVALTGAQLAADPAAATALLSEACTEVIRDVGAQSVILGGAGLAGIAGIVARLQTAETGIGVPNIDSVTAGTVHALRIPAGSPSRSRAGFDVAWNNVSPELTAFGLRGSGS